MTFEMIEASHYFLVAALESLAREFLEKEAAQNTRDDLMRMLSVGVEFEQALDVKEAILREIIRCIGDDWFEGGYQCKLSRKAAEYIISSTRIECNQKERQPSMLEYNIFRNVVLWHVYQAGPSSRKGLSLLKCQTFPGRSYLWKNLLKMPNVDKFISEVLACSAHVVDSTAKLNSFLGVEICKDSLEQMLLEQVKLDCIPVSLLITVIHPLRIFSPTQLLKGLICGSLSRRVECLSLQTDWVRSSYTALTGDNGRFSCYYSHRCGVDMAVAILPDPRSSNEFEFSFEILEDDAVSIDLGFICLLPDRWDDIYDMVEESPRDYPESRIVCIKKERHTRVSRKNLRRSGRIGTFAIQK